MKYNVLTIYSHRRHFQEFIEKHREFIDIYRKLDYLHFLVISGSMGMSLLEPDPSESLPLRVRRENRL